MFGLFPPTNEMTPIDRSRISGRCVSAAISSTITFASTVVDLLTLSARAMRHIDIDKRRVETFMRGGNAKRKHFLRIELHGETDNWLDAAKMLFQHQPFVGEHRPHQIVDAVARLKQTLKRHIAKIMVPKLSDFFLRNEGGSRTNLPVVANDQDFLAAQNAGNSVMSTERLRQ